MRSLISGSLRLSFFCAAKSGFVTRFELFHFPGAERLRQALQRNLLTLHRFPAAVHVCFVIQCRADLLCFISLQ
jgi:hypothetical protein